MNFRYKLAQFMYGRNGPDFLSKAALIGYFALWFINLFFRWHVLRLLSFALLAYSLFRILSRDVYRRQQENQKFFNWWQQVKQRFAESKTKYYHKCPHCKATLRLPRKRGKHSVCCPKCRQNFKVHIWFGD